MAVGRVAAIVARLSGFADGQRTRKFVVDLGYLLGTDAALTLVTFGLTAAVVRVLGPAEFGQVNLVVSVSQVWVTFMLVGLHAAATRYIAADPERSPAIISTSLTLSLLIGIVLFPALLTGRHLAQQAFRVSPAVFGWSVLLAYGLVPQQLTNGILAGQGRFRIVSRCNLAAGLTFAAAIVGLLAWADTITVGEVIVANVVRALVFSGFAFVAVARTMGRPSVALGRHMLGFGGYHMFTALAYFLILGSIDNLMLNAYHGAHAVGLYAAYYVPFNLFTSRIMKFVSDVLMPTLAAHEDRPRLLRRVALVYARSAPVVIAVVCAITYALFYVYSGAFEFRWTLAMLMAINVWLHAASGALGDFLLAAGTRGVRWSMYGAFATAAVNVGANLCLIPPYGPAGAMVASLLAFLVALSVRAFALSRLP
jgi:O-antigen/teichoic acid export membrane protein